MRRIALVFVVVCAAFPWAGTAASAHAPTPAPSAAGPETVCTVNDSKLTELSGIAAIDGGYWVINDSNPDASAKRIFKLDNQCKLVSSVQYPTNSLDAEDMAVAGDGTVWVADIGDNNAERRTVAFWKLSPGKQTPVVYRVTYPDGKHDAEAILLDSAGNPMIITKDIGKAPGVFVPTKELEPNTQAGVPLKKAGEIKLPSSDTPNPFSIGGRSLITGGANAPDNKRVVLRTYADALEYDVPDGDVAKALTTGAPRVTPMPNEPQGEAITYTRDGSAFVTVSDVTAKNTPLLKYKPAAPAAAVADTKKSAGPETEEAGGLSELTLNDITYLVAGVGVLGLVLVVVGIVGIRRSRKQRSTAAAANRGEAGRGPNGPGPGRAPAPAPVVGDDFDFDAPTAPGQGQPRAGRREPPPQDPPTGGVYRSGGQPGGGGGGGAVYGGRRDPEPGWDDPNASYGEPRGYGRR
jgi:hypothetical protein